MNILIRLCWSIVFLLPYSICSQTWEPVGGGVSLFVKDFYSDVENQLLYVVGNFNYAGSTEVRGIAVWDGQLWASLPYTDVQCDSIFCYFVGSIQKYESEIFVGGGFPNSQYLKRLDDEIWLNSGSPNSTGVLDEANGELFFMGTFDTIEGISVPNGLAKWNGEGWQLFGEPLEIPTWYISDVEYYQEHYYFAGNFSLSDGKREIMYLDNNNQFQALGDGMFGNSWVNSIVVYNGILFVGGHFTQFDGNAGNYIMAWDGLEWFNPFPEINYTSQVQDMAIIDGELFIAGLYQTADPCCAYCIGKYDGDQFCTFGGKTYLPELPGNPHVIAGMHDRVYVGIGGYPFFGSPSNFLMSLPKETPSDYCVEVDIVSTNSDGYWPDSKGMQLQPNPCTTHFILEFLNTTNQPKELILYSLSGQRVKSEPLSAGQRHTVDVSDLEAGMYVVQLMENGQPSGTAKLVVQGR